MIVIYAGVRINFTYWRVDGEAVRRAGSGVSRVQGAGYSLHYSVESVQRKPQKRKPQRPKFRPRARL